MGISAILTSDLPYAKVEIGKTYVTALLDSGSAINAISKQALISIFKKMPKLGKADIKCRSASTDILEILGVVKLKVRFENFSWYLEFFVMDVISSPVILGTPFFKQSGLTLDFLNRQFFFKFIPDIIFPIIDFSPDCVPVLDNELLFSVADTQVDFDKLLHLPSVKRHALTALLNKFPDVLTTELGTSKVCEYEIELVDNTPVRRPPYRLSPPKVHILREHIAEMLESGVIRPSTSNYSSPVFLVPKPDGKFRPVIDYRHLNAKINIESVPLPDVHTAFAWFKGATIFSSLDLNQAYYQIPLAESCKKYTAFCTDWNLFEYNKVPFGLATGAQVLTRTLDKIFADVKFQYVYHYLDDLVIYSNNFEEHLAHLEEVLTRLRQAGLTVNPGKVKFATDQLSFLGHKVSAHGVTIDPERTKSILAFAVPRNATEVARFLGMVNYFHKFIPNLANVAAPLNMLRKKGVKFEWTSEQENAFRRLQECIVSPPVLAIPDFSKSFILQTDASPVALGAVLLQETGDGRRAIAYASRTLTMQERKYSIFELEALAVLFGTEKFKMYLEHVEFELETDSQALSWVLAKPRTTGRIARWAVRLSAFKFSVRHIRGVDNAVADALSRMFTSEPVRDESLSEPSPVASNTLSFQDDNNNNLVMGILSEMPLAFESLREYQANDHVLGPIIERLERSDPVAGYFLKKSLLYCMVGKKHLFRVALPAVLIPLVFKFFHESPVGGHLGIFKTRDKIRQYFSWQGMDADIRVRVKACEVCAMAKPSQRTNYGLLASEVPTTVMDRLVIDYVGKLPRSSDGNQYILVVVDSFSKFVWMFPTRECTTHATMEALKRIFAVMGFPKSLVSDNASCFTSGAFRRFCFNLGIKHITTSPYHPQASLAERVNRNLKSALIAYHSGNHRLWDRNLFWLSFAFNTARHDAHKEVPASLVLGFPVRNPLSNLWCIDDLLPDANKVQDVKETWRRARTNLQISHKRKEARYKASRTSVPFAVGDKVWLRNHPKSRADAQVSAKLAPRYKGPYVIVEFLTPVTVRLRDPQSGLLTKAHVGQLKNA